MNYIKQSIKIISMFVLMFAVVVGAIIFMEYRNSKLMNEVTLYVVDDANFGNALEDVQNDGIWSRLRSIKNSVAVTKNEEFLFDDEMKAYLITEMTDQLTLMQDFNVLPALPFSEIEAISFMKETYISDSSERANPINVWEIKVSYPGFGLCVYMDEETSAIYDITITGEVEFDSYSYDRIRDGFMEYLKLFSADNYDSWEQFGTMGYFDSNDSNVVSLYVISKNSVTEQVTSYRFNDDVTNFQNISEAE